jgi:Hg(II)-responsive transcriptional regulator
MSKFTISKAATASGVGVETIRFYERRGLIEQPRPTATAFREYPPSVVERIRFIKRSQELGFTLDEISELLILSDRAGESRNAVRELASKKLDAIKNKIADLQRMELTLSKLVHDCSGRGPVAGCPIIQAITGNESHCEHKNG